MTNATELAAILKAELEAAEAELAKEEQLLLDEEAAKLNKEAMALKDGYDITFTALESREGRIREYLGVKPTENQTTIDIVGSTGIKESVSLTQNQVRKLLVWLKANQE